MRAWLDDFIEDQLEVSEEFKAKVQRAKQEIANGVYPRKREPEAGPRALRLQISASWGGSLLSPCCFLGIDQSLLTGAQLDFERA